jgi:hypothetical protein
MRIFYGLPIKIVIVWSLIICWAQASELNIEATKVEPGIVYPGDPLFIMCRINHPEGFSAIESVGATAYYGKWITTFPALYDDGTHGDQVANDGIYSLEIKAANIVGEEKIVFKAVDKYKNEIESEPVVITIE